MNIPVGSSPDPGLGKLQPRGLAPLHRTDPVLHEAPRFEDANTQLQRAPQVRQDRGLSLTLTGGQR